MASQAHRLRRERRSPAAAWKTTGLRDGLDDWCMVGDLAELAPFAKADQPAAVNEATALRLTADGGDAEAQFKLGTWLLTGHLLDEDEAAAIRYFRLAADQGNADAQCSLGFCLENGHGTDKDVAEAMRYYRLAAEQGKPEGRRALSRWQAQDKGKKNELGEGDTLNRRYSIVRRLGEGGMGVVYEGRHIGTGRRVAIKVITSKYADDPDLRARFRDRDRQRARLAAVQDLHRHLPKTRHSRAGRGPVGQARGGRHCPEGASDRAARALPERR